MNNIIPTIKYLLLTLKHKWFVLIVGINLNVSIWRLLKHDLSKLSYKELPHYGRQFFGKADQPENFIKCWIHHQNHNDHHWEYWIPRTGHNKCKSPYKDGEPINMPEYAVREMIADWMAAGRAYEGKWPDVFNWEWFIKNHNSMKLHPVTKRTIVTIIKQYAELYNENYNTDKKFSTEMKDTLELLDNYWRS